MSPSNTREQVFFGSDHSPTGAWVGGGVAFLFIVFIIAAVAFFNHSRHGDVDTNIRENGRLSNQGLLEAAYARGEANVRQANTLSYVERISNVVTELRSEIREAALMNRDTTRESAQGIIDTGRTFGFRTVDFVHPDPCRDRCGNDRVRERDFARLHGTFALPTATAPGTIDAEINGRRV